MILEPLKEPREQKGKQLRKLKRKKKLVDSRVKNVERWKNRWLV
jgi:hypothetical protein